MDGFFPYLVQMITRRVCRMPWSLTLTYIFKVIHPWVCNKTAKIWHILPSLLYSTEFWMNSFHIWHKWSLAWEGVLRTMTCDLDLYTKLFSCDTYILLFCYVAQIQPMKDDVSCSICRSKVKVTRILRCFVFGQWSTISSCILQHQLNLDRIWEQDWIHRVLMHTELFLYNL